MDERSWEGLLATPLAIIGDIEAQGVGAPDLVGGTVLMMRMHHRRSKNIEIFLHAWSPR